MAKVNLNSLTQKIQARPRLVTGVVVLLIWIWVGWQLFSVVFDHEISESELISHQVRVQQEQLDQVSDNLTAYRQPTPVTDIPSTPFLTPTVSPIDKP